MLTVPEAARRAKRNPETIRRWIREGKLTSWKVGAQYLIDEDDLSDAIRGVFASPGGLNEADAPMTTAQIVSEIHRGRAERTHRLNEVLAPYLVTRSAEAGSPTSTADAWLSHIVGRIVRDIDPAQIILFGSRARGEAHSESDYDLLVVVDGPVDRRATRIVARQSFEDLPVAADVVVATTEEVSSGRGRPRGVLHWALTEGRVVYERA